MNKKPLSERDICTKFITPNLIEAGWDIHNQVREEVSFTDGRIYVRGTMHTRGARKRADYILYYKPNIPIAVIEAKDNKHSSAISLLLPEASWGGAWAGLCVVSLYLAILVGHAWNNTGLYLLFFSTNIGSLPV